MSRLSGTQNANQSNNEDHRVDGSMPLNRPDLPAVVIPPSTRAGMEDAFLTRINMLPPVVCSMTIESTTLKAWFALKLQNVAQKGEILKRSILPQWGTTWALINKQKASWDQQYGTSGPSPTHWELHEPSSVGELYALAMFVLYKNVQSNPDMDDQRVLGLKWHNYYDVEESRYFLLYNFLIFLEAYSFGGGAIRVDPPIEELQLPSWKINTVGGKMHTSVQQFQKDHGWHAGTLRGYEAQPRALTGKTVGFIVDEGTDARQVFTRVVNSVLQGAQDYFTKGAGHSGQDYTASASARVHKQARWRVDKIENILEYVRAKKEPWIWLETAPEGQSGFDHTNQANETRPQHPDHSRHPVLQLETWVGTLTQPDAGYATSLFALLRRNHRRSRDFVEDLTALFAPFRQLNTINSERSRSLIEIIEGQIETASHQSHLAKIESLAVDLEGTSADDARAILYLVRRGFGTCRDYLDELKVIFAPLQQRSVEEMERATRIKKVFEAIDREAEVIDVG